MSTTTPTTAPTTASNPLSQIITAISSGLTPLTGANDPYKNPVATYNAFDNQPQPSPGPPFYTPPPPYSGYGQFPQYTYDGNECGCEQTPAPTECGCEATPVCYDI